MIEPPGELPNTHAIMRYMNILRRCILARTPRPTPEMELIEVANGFTLKPKVNRGGASASATGGVFRGVGYDDEGRFPNAVYQPFDYVQYVSGESGLDTQAIWYFAWGDDEPSSDVNEGPIAQIRSGTGIYLIPTNGSWMFHSYIPIGGSAQAVPNATAYTQLLDSYPDQ